jgi:hypothetical protein
MWGRSPPTSVAPARSRTPGDVLDGVVASLGGAAVVTGARWRYRRLDGGDQRLAGARDEGELAFDHPTLTAPVIETAPPQLDRSVGCSGPLDPLDPILQHLGGLLRRLTRRHHQQRLGIREHLRGAL